ncbi:hypothetical protein EYW49_08460 [Siculibacillus lacustris]|uniref:Transglycosylase SLT domain-containing protein n=1 Tax=Siculibacillus lacustris TaxID=1549641 RepID=A0A4Q9VUK7_9HYPH|nr:transglycosylase SLT domain-containing protein [Siculibacillus lacustris]TBW38718.1 hypothetical protein EYW49_08460 [Siculibacillus lacustris]
MTGRRGIGSAVIVRRTAGRAAAVLAAWAVAGFGPVPVPRPRPETTTSGPRDTAETPAVTVRPVSVPAEAAFPQSFSAGVLTDGGTPLTTTTTTTTAPEPEWAVAPASPPAGPVAAAPSPPSGRGDRLVPPARIAPVPPERIAAAFDLFPAPTGLRGASGTGPVGGAPFVAPAPAVITPRVALGDPAPAPIAGLLAFAPEEPAAAIDRARASPGGRPIAVPLPRQRPRPIVETAVSDQPALPALPAARPRDEVRLASLGPTPGESVDEDGEAPVAAGIRRASGEPRRIPTRAEPYLALLRREAAANGVPLWLAIGVGWVESKFDPNLRGRHGVIGLMQVMPGTARYLGYRGPIDRLRDPETNIVWGMRELGAAWKATGGDACLTIAKYTGGIRTTTITPAAATYCRTARDVTGMS